MHKQRIIILVSGIVLAIMAVFMVNAYLGQQKQLIKEQAKKAIAQIQANQTAVLVAKKEIPKGVTIEPDMLEVKVVPNQYVQPQAVTSLDRVAGMVTVAPFAKSEQVTLSKLTRAKQSGQAGGLAMSTPVGKRAITISIDNIASLAGMIKAGDYVDVIAIVPIPVTTSDGKQGAQPAVVPLFQNVLVLAVGQDTGGGSPEESARYKKAAAAESSPLITLALGSKEASLIAFVQEQGKIRLTLRSPADSQIEPLQPASWDTLFQYIMPVDARQQSEPKPEVSYVEIYRGLNKEKVAIPK